MKPRATPQKMAYGGFQELFENFQEIPRHFLYESFSGVLKLREAVEASHARTYPKSRQAIFS